jgi:long-chain acyl-CoA synthetase
MPRRHEDPGVSRLLDGHPAASTAVVFGGRRWTYADLSSATANLALHMTDLAGQRVAFMLPNCPEAILIYLACFRTGALAVPLNTRYAPP